MASVSKQPISADSIPPAKGGEGSLGITLGIVLTGIFYLAVWAFPHPWVQRYFLGHPVSIGATLLFGIAGGMLLVKAIQVAAEARLVAGLRDADLAPPPSALANAADQWLHKHDAGRAAKQWQRTLVELPQNVRESRLVIRLRELLERQSSRVSTRHLSDDLRELSSRDGDSAHDSLQLVRIIIWAIPMLGFLGTVIGITQTLGGLDFTDGTAAVDRLKSGLYVAFDTTAMGLVLSVVAIFLQFPVERLEQQLLGDIDRLVGRLLNANLPSDDVADNPSSHIAELCEGIRVAVAQSLASQTDLWRSTIDEAHQHWQRIAEDNGSRIGDAIMQSLAPALREHALSLTAQTATMVEHRDAIRDQTDSHRDHATMLRDQTAALSQVHTDAVEALERRWSQWSMMLADSTRVLGENQQAIVVQMEEFGLQRDQTERFIELQSTLDNNLLRLGEANAAARLSLETSASEGMPTAMLTLAAAVEVLANKLPQDAPIKNAASFASESSHRRAA